MSPTRVAVHGALLAAPFALLGRVETLAHAPGLGCIVAMLVLAEVEAGARTTSDPCGARAPGTGLAVVSGLGLLLTAWAAIGFPSSTSSSWMWVGVPMLLSGGALRAAAIRSLGASFTSEIVAAPGRPLVTHGVYAWLRHPSDAGLLLVAFGLACLGGSAAAAVVAGLIVVPSVVLRMAREDRELARMHPEHAAYRRRVSLWRSLVEVLTFFQRRRA